MHRSEVERLEAAWNAFPARGKGEGWRVISLGSRGPCFILAGRHFPTGEEAVLVGFPQARLPTQGGLPEGNGFAVRLATDRALPASCIALSRRPQASLEMFTMMAADVLAMLARHVEATETDLLYLFLGRIRGWQDFMERGSISILGPESELGLVGELVLLQRLLEEGVGKRACVEAWKGPQRGLHDFTLGTGAIEVKATLSDKGFPAKVQSLDQFDDLLRHPLYCCAVRFAEASDGATLPEHAGATAALLQDDAIAPGLFETRLLQAGYLPDTADRYVRRLLPLEVRLLRVAGEFPRLTASSVPPGVLRARYEVDLDHFALDDVGLTNALRQLEGA